MYHSSALVCLILYQTTKFMVTSKLIAFCKRQITGGSSYEICLRKDRKSCENRRKCQLQAFMLSPTKTAKVSSPVTAFEDDK